MKKLFLVFIIISINAFAKDLGVYGEVWEIDEKDALVEIMDKLQNMEKSGEIEQQNKKFAEKTKKKILRPTPVAGIKHTIKPRTFSYEPSIRYNKDLKDHKGQVFYKAGTKVNSLDYISLPYELLFIDGDDKYQLLWALAKYRKAEIKPLIILVKGEPIRLNEEHEIDFYFDQFGVMTKKLKIEQVPALVKQDGRSLKISELILKCGKNEGGKVICQEK